MLSLDVVLERHPPVARGRQASTWLDDRGSVIAESFVGEGPHRVEWRDLGVFVFDAGSTTVQVWPAPGVEHAAIRDAFARVIQPIILQALGYQALHASAVRGADGVLAFCGVGRSGKSTLAYAMGQDGYEQVADDAVIIESGREGPTVHFVPFAPGLRPATRDYFTRGVADATRCAETRLATIASAPLRAVFILQQDPSRREPEPPQPISPVQAFAALVTHARCFDEHDPSHTRQLVEDYLNLAARVPVFAIAYPPDFVQLTSLIGGIDEVARSLGVTRLFGRDLNHALVR